MAERPSTPAPPWAIATVWAARLGVAAVFVLAAIPKLLDVPAFAADVRNYQAFPDATVHLVAGIVPAMELVGAASLVTGLERRAGAVVLGLLTIGFIALIASVLVRGIDLQCGCFGRDAEAASVGWSLVARDVALLVAIGIAAACPSRLGAAVRRRLPQVS